MRLWLVRHAEAVAVGEQGVSRDAMRSLTERGQRRARLIGEALARLNVRPAMVVTSPLLRARQTAEVLAHVLGVTAPLRVCMALTPEAEPDQAWRALLDHGPHDLLVVGHLPSLATLAGWLLSPTAPAGLHLRKTAVLELRFEGQPTPGHACLEWLLNPACVEALREEA